MGIRDLIKSICPPWLIGPYKRGLPFPEAVGVGERIMYAFTLASDSLIEKTVTAAHYSFPNFLDASSLPYVGVDRGIPRGPIESDASYGERLRVYLDTWRKAGSTPGVLQSIAGYLSPIGPKIQSVLEGYSIGVATSVWDVLIEGSTPGGAIDHTQVTPKNWVWDALNYPRRRWLILRDKNDATGAPWITATRYWGDGTVWGQRGVAWGGDLQPEVAQSIFDILGDWKSAATRYWWVIVNFNPAHFDASLAPGDTNNPNASFANWSKIDTSGARPVRVRSRFSDARYFQGPRS